jgi:two-component system chemotaxis response regulator CheB
MSRIKAFVVDDSAVVRQVLTALIDATPGMEVMHAAADPLLAMERMRRQWPDVIVLDVEMPRMDGITFLRKIMTERPTPVVICSTLTEQGAKTTMEALSRRRRRHRDQTQAGPQAVSDGRSDDLVSTVREAARANVRRLAFQGRGAPGGGQAVGRCGPATRFRSCDGPDHRARGRHRHLDRWHPGARGGADGIAPRVCPGIVIVQHMPEKFTAAFASRLDSICRIAVKEAEHNDRVLPGRALIAPGGKHMVLRRSGAQYHVDVVDGPLVNRHRPSVDVLFRSVAKCAGANAVGIIMTGMGDDGAAGLLEMHNVGAQTVAQDEESCVVFGMPKEAIALDAVERVVPLSAIAGEIQGQLNP